MTTRSLSPKLVFFFLILVQVLFAINYITSKVILSYWDPFLWTQIRVFSSTALFLILVLVVHPKHPKPKSSFFLPLVLFSLLAVLIPQLAFQSGMSLTTSTNAAILNTLIPIFTLMIAVIVKQERLTKNRSLGFLLALMGALIIRKIEEFSLSNGTFIGDLLMVLNSLSLSCFFVFSKKFVEKHDRLWVTTWLFVYASLFLSLLAFPSWNQFAEAILKPVDLTLLLCVFFSVVGATILTYFLNNVTLAYARASQVALLIYVQPILTAILAWAFLKETPTWRSILSCILIFLGILIASIERKRKDSFPSS